MEKIVGHAHPLSAYAKWLRSTVVARGAGATVIVHVMPSWVVDFDSASFGMSRPEKGIKDILVEFRSAAKGVVSDFSLGLSATQLSASSGIDRLCRPFDVTFPGPLEEGDKVVVGDLSTFAVDPACDKEGRPVYFAGRPLQTCRRLTNAQIMAGPGPIFIDSCTCRVDGRETALSLLSDQLKDNGRAPLRVRVKVLAWLGL
jgi:hypothetical protein